MDDDIAGEPSYPVGMAYSRAGREMTGQDRRGQPSTGWTGNERTTRERGGTEVEIHCGPPWAVSKPAPFRHCCSIIACLGLVVAQ